MKLADLVTIKKGKKPADIVYEEQPGFRRLLQIDDLRAHARNKYCPPSNEEVWAEPRDIVIAWDGANAGTSNFGLSGVLGSTLAVLSPMSDGIFSPYLGHFLKSQATFLRKMCNGAAIPHIDGQVLGALNIPLPPLPEQRRIAAILDQADALRAKRRAAMTMFGYLARSIFVDLFGDPATNPKGWDRAELSSLVEGQGGIKCGPFGTQLGKHEYRSCGVPLWGIRQVNRQFTIGTNEYLSEEKAATLTDYNLCGGDIVMTRKGTVGNCAVYPKHLPIGVMHSDLLRIRLNPLADTTFMTFQLRHSREITHQLSVMSSGAVMPGINVSKLKSLRVLIPPLALQQQFSDWLAACDILSDQNRSALGLLDDLFASLQHRAFQGTL